MSTLMVKEEYEDWSLKRSEVPQYPCTRLVQYRSDYI